MNLIKYSIVFATIIFTQSASAMEELNKKQEEIAAQQPLMTAESNNLLTQLGIRPLIIIFDPHNDDIYQKELSCYLRSALTNAFFGALQNKIPIITSHLFLDFALNCKETRDLRPLWDIYSYDPDPKGNQPQALAVLIPKSDNPLVFKQPYLNQYDKLLDTYTIDKSKQLSDGEILLGIRVKKLRKISTFTDDDRTPTGNLKDGLKDILVTRSTLRQLHLNDDYLNRWDIFIQGHGQPGKQIAGMSIAPIAPPKRLESFFNLFLDFLNLDINTRSLFYLTCFSGTTNLVEPYHHVKDLNYMIICANTFSSPTSSYARYEPNSFDTYFNKLNLYLTNTPDQTGAVPNLANIAENVQDWKQTFRDRSPQLPTARSPHGDWFNMIDVNAQVFKITDSLIRRTIQKQKPENQKIIIPADVILVIIESRYIPIPVVIKEGTMKKLPLMLPLDAGKDYYFEELQIPDAYIAHTSMKDLSLAHMMGILLRRVHSSERFFIKKMVLKISQDDIFLASDNAQQQLLTTIYAPTHEATANTLENVIISLTENKEFGSFYTHEKVKVIGEYNTKNNSIARLCFECTSKTPTFNNDTRLNWRAMTEDEQKIFENQSSLINQIREQSKLPESMKGKNPKPMIQLIPASEPGSKAQIVSNPTTEHK